jgi:hypothetical protein
VSPARSNPASVALVWVRRKSVLGAPSPASGSKPRGAWRVPAGRAPRARAHASHLGEARRAGAQRGGHGRASEPHARPSWTVPGPRRAVARAPATASAAATARGCRRSPESVCEKPQRSPGGAAAATRARATASRLEEPLPHAPAAGAQR